MRLPVHAFMILTTVTSLSVANADDSTARSRELEVLNRFAGTWDIQGSVSFAGNDPVESSGVETRTWSAGGNVIEFENAAAPEFHMLVTYDPNAAEYVGVLMSGPSRGTVTGEWDADSETMTFVVTFTDGNRYEGTTRFIDERNIEANGTLTDADGEVIFEMSMEQTRH